MLFVKNEDLTPFFPKLWRTDYFYIIGFVTLILLSSPVSVHCKIINVGSEDGFYKTINAAIKSAADGDIIKVHKGVYNEELLVNIPNITIVGADADNPPVIDGSDQTFLSSHHTWKKVSGHIYKTDYSWPHKQLTDEQFTEYSGGIGETRVALQLYEDGELLRGYRNRHDPDYVGYNQDSGISGAYRNLTELNPVNDNGLLPQYLRRPNIKIPGRFMYKEDGHQLYVWCADESTPEGKKYNIPIRTHLVKINAKGVKLKNLVIRYSGGYAISLNNSDNVIIDHCYLDNNIYGIYVLNSKDVTISNNLIRIKGLWNRYWYDDVKATALGSYMIKVDGFALSIRCQIFNNIIYGSYGILAGGQKMRIFHNIISYSPSVLINASEINESRGVPPAYDHDLSIYDNILHHADFSSIAVSFVSKGDIWFYRNLVYEVKYFIKDGTSYKSQIESESRGKKYFYHNTVVGLDSLIHNPYKYAVNKKTVFRNNIFMSRVHLYTFYNESINYFPFTAGPDSDNNLMWITSRDDIGEFQISPQSIKYYHNNEFQSFTRDTGLETHSMFVEPGLDNLNIMELNAIDTVSSKNIHDFITYGYDSVFQASFSSIHDKFTLSGHSKAIDKGVNLEAYPDYIDADHKDIGALELKKKISNHPQIMIMR
jgi:parallel beta-helix repeat protein